MKELKISDAAYIFGGISAIWQQKVPSLWTGHLKNLMHSKILSFRFSCNHVADLNVAPKPEFQDLKPWSMEN